MITHFQIPIQLGSVLIRPGDLVLGDIDGVIIVPRALVMRVLERAEEVLVTEDKIFEWVNSGETVEQIKAKGGYF
jgi:4-hydroxy-4-methyl-2-oxoglutarate aldolase